MATSAVPRTDVESQLERMLASETFSGADRSAALLRFLVQHALDNHSQPPKEYTLGAEVLGRGAGFDPRTDPIVRAEASRLRARLERYYATLGAADAVLITLPKGAYAPSFSPRVVSASPTRTTEIGGQWPQRLAWFALGGALAALLGLALWPPRPVSRQAAPFEFDVTLGRSELSLGSDFGCDLALSPDGTRLVFVVRGRDGQLRLAVRELGQPTTVDLPGTEGARTPFFSPDGRWVAFWALGKLKKTSVDGGSPVELADAADFGGGSWTEAGELIVALSRALVRVPASPGTPSVIIDLATEGILPRWPQALRGGGKVLFTAIGATGPNSATIEVLSLADGRRTTVLRGGTYARALENGHLVYVNQGTLYALPFDETSLVPRGTAVPTRESVAYAATFGFAQFDVSRNGTLVYRRSPARGQLSVALVDRDGGRKPLPLKPGDYVFPRLSPDGALLALGFAEAGALGTLVYDISHDRVTRLPPAAGNLPGAWSPDGRFLVLGSARGMLWTRRGDLTKLVPLTMSSRIQMPLAFTADGTRIAYQDLGASTAFDLWTLPIRVAGATLEAGEPELFLKTDAFETYPAFSPDGRWIAYASGAYGPWDVYVRPFPPSDVRETRVSDGGGRISRWLPGARQIVYRTDDHRLMVVDYSVQDGSFVASKPRPWLPGRLGDTGVLGNFDLRPEAEGVVALLSSGSEEDRPAQEAVTVVLNYSREVADRVSRAAPRPSEAPSR